ncbi:MAG TPA: hypothetical protein VLT47_13980 [Anaeromyxobacteraceae bacterium]|nr:hypothetical protein [Anaeromyxobacteraceae bacterium]
MAQPEPIEIACPGCGLTREFPRDRAPATLPHHCPRCGADLVADGLLVEAEPRVGDPSPALAGDPAAEPLFPAPLGAEAVAVTLLAAFLAWSYLTRGFAAAALAGADLVFHEAGHPILGLLGSRFLMFLGGTLGQLAFPVTAAVAFARRRQAAPFAVAVLWLGFNLVEIGRYAADAQARVLPLLAPDEDSHDWWNLLGMLGVRDHCLGIGGTIQAIGWLLWGAAPAWLGWQWWRTRR